MTSRPPRARSDQHRIDADDLGIRLDATDLEALLALARASTPAAARKHAARLRALLGPAAPRLEPHIEAIVAHAEQLERSRQLALTDPLTGVANRRALNHELQRELARAERSGHPLSVVLLDIDAFKRINDTRGHLAGDHALQLVARCTQQVTRRGDVVARTGGDEFALMLPETDRREARAIGERVRVELARASEPDLPVQVSLGFATVRAGACGGATAVLAAADADLYHDKVRRKSLRPRAA